MIYAHLRSLVLALTMAIVLLVPAGAQAQQVRISKLTDVGFGAITNFAIDQTRSQSVCAHSSSGRYEITATGSGAGGAFTLATTGGTMAYEVQWDDTPGQTTGTALTAGVALTNQTTNSTFSLLSGCIIFAPATTASLITILRSSAINAARAGAYTGTLTLLIAPD